MPIIAIAVVSLVAFIGGFLIGFRFSEKNLSAEDMRKIHRDLDDNCS